MGRRRGPSPSLLWLLVENINPKSLELFAMVAATVLFVVATIAFLDDDDIDAKGERKRQRQKMERKKRKRKGGCYDINMVLPFMFCKFFFS